MTHTALNSLEDQADTDVWTTCWCGRAKDARRAVCDRCAQTGPIRESHLARVQQIRYGHATGNRTLALTEKYHAERQAEVDAESIRAAKAFLFAPLPWEVKP